jgi:DNA-binding FadR family transcriptional regulator
MPDLAARSSTSFHADDLREREPRLRERLAGLLAREIVSDRLPPGAPFPSADELVARFEVSRTVAREALQTLSMLGMVKVQHGKRTEVLPMENWNILSSVVQTALRSERRATPIISDTYAFRLLIEPQGAAWMAEHGSDEQLAELHDLAAEMLSEAESGDPVRVLASDRRFHNLIAAGSGNVIYAAVARDIREVIATLWELSDLRTEEAQVVATQHSKIAEAIVAREPARAAREMREHLIWAMQEDLGNPEANG